MRSSVDVETITAYSIVASLSILSELYVIFMPKGLYKESSNGVLLSYSFGVEDSASDLLVRSRRTSYRGLGPEDLVSSVDPCLPYIWFSGFFTTCLFYWPQCNDCISGQLRGQLHQHLSVILCVVLFIRYMLLFLSSIYFLPFPDPQRWCSARKNENWCGKFLSTPIACDKLSYHYLVITIQQTGIKCVNMANLGWSKLPRNWHKQKWPLLGGQNCPPNVLLKLLYTLQK